MSDLNKDEEFKDILIDLKNGSRLILNQSVESVDSVFKNKCDKQSELISVDYIPVNGSYDWKIGDKAIAYGGYFFEIEWDGDSWTSICGDDFTHWMPLPDLPEVNK